MQSSNVQRREKFEGICEEDYAVKRNPYLVDFEAQRRRGRGGRTEGGSRGQLPSRSGQLRSREIHGRRSREAVERPGNNQARRVRDGAAERVYGRNQTRCIRSIYTGVGTGRQAEPGTYAGGASGSSRETTVPAPAPGRQSCRSAAMARRRKRVMMQRALAGIWGLCILVLAAALLLRNGQVSAGAGSEDGRVPADGREADGDAQQYSGRTVQGIPAEKFAAHPQWTEDFLTINDYSRPGDPLVSVSNIFVHYTANPGTSAAQNRSYFEWLKDTHETSASAHFIIGYDGEIIQCVPLDEVAYAVQTRNEDSISIECCYLEEDGSFTQETYDSLLSLLAWLKDAYDLETEDILRHYDCGGKKCPLYYTDNPDAWEDLKKDVDKL